MNCLCSLFLFVSVCAWFCLIAHTDVRTFVMKCLSLFSFKKNLIFIPILINFVIWNNRNVRDELTNIIYGAVGAVHFVFIVTRGEKGFKLFFVPEFDRQIKQETNTIDVEWKRSRKIGTHTHIHIYKYKYKTTTATATATTINFNTANKWNFFNRIQLKQ